MITIRRSDERGHASHGWLDTHHTFSFAGYYDPQHMGFRSLRVINEDYIAPGRGFGTHSHRDMEILTYVLEGALEHKDSMGTSSVIRPGEVQRMTAGTGVAHSEYNPSSTEQVHLLQIWLLPEAEGLEPGYEQRLFPLEKKKARLQLVASREGRDDSVRVHQDVSLYAAQLDVDDVVSYQLKKGRAAWIQVVRGDIRLNEKSLTQGDAAAVCDEDTVRIVGVNPSEILLFDLA